MKFLRQLKCFIFGCPLPRKVERYDNIYIRTCERCERVAVWAYDIEINRWLLQD